MQKAMIMHNSSQNNPLSNSSSQIDIDAGLAAILAQCQDAAASLNPFLSHSRLNLFAS